MKRKRYSQLVYDDIQKLKQKQNESKRKDELKKKYVETASKERQRSEWRNDF